MLTIQFSPFNVISGTIAAVLLGVSIAPQPGYTISGQDIDLQVGVVQRFGRQPSDLLTLQAQPGDRLMIRFQVEGKPQTLSAATAKLAIVQQALPTPQLEERVVLGTHRSYESAEDEANRWRAEGIPVEIAQPKRWQVWAKRDVYHTPLLRRLLLQSLQGKGIQSAFVDTQVLQKRPKVVLEVNGQRVAQDQLQISSAKGIIKVVSQRTDDPPKPKVPPERVERLYSGNLRLQPNAYGTYTLVNQVPLETYLRGVVPHEIGGSTTSSVLETQAILARTYALRNLRRFAIDDYQLCADTQCQVYYGLTGVMPETDQAITATRGRVLTYQNELVDAVYSAATGGVTAAFNDVWHGPNRPYLRPIIDSVAARWDLSRQSLADEQNFRQFVQQKKGFNEDDQKWFRWRYESTLKELNQDLREYLTSLKSPLANFKTIQRLEVLQRSPAGRVQTLRVTTDQGAIDLEKDNILIAFYAPASLLFYIDPMYDAQKKLAGYTFVGGGLGHGVGLSQSGSYRLGKLGWSSERILSFYYPGTQVQAVNNSLVFWRDPANPQDHTPQM